ncbi:MAG: sulfatase-like hydrolase/transferase [Pirellulaceae bacterium]|jgi:hypothetical protein|nr:sulfatase-like hydrolase/transferase [Pirellulaceae bacterium]MDP6557759.1 sulfatase-like hydrolase/transferase [Pirellulaceae bacterium]
MISFTHSHWIAGLACCLSAVGSGNALAEPSNATERPNIVFILSDDQGWTGLSVAMHDALPNSKSDFYRTPHLEQLAEQCMRFTDAYAPAPVCSPTRYHIRAIARFALVRSRWSLQTCRENKLSASLSY